MSILQKLTIVTRLISDIYQNACCEHADKFNTFMPTKLILMINSHADKTNTCTDMQISMSSIDFKLNMPTNLILKSYTLFIYYIKVSFNLEFSSFKILFSSSNFNIFCFSLSFSIITSSYRSIILIYDKGSSDCSEE